MISRTQRRFQIPNYLPKSIKSVVYVLLSIAAVLIIFGFFGFFGSIFVNAMNFGTTPPGRTTFESSVSIMKIGVMFWGLIFIGIFLSIVSQGIIFIASRIYKPELAPQNQHRREHRLYFPKIQEVQDGNLRQSLIAAVKNLNIENVDMGMFYLGKIFEQELKTYLTKAQQTNAFSVSNKDLERLASMLDCLENNKIDIVGDKHLMTFLRQQRNERVHGKIPTFSERQRMLEQAPFIAGLYIDSIVEIHKRKTKL